jgi:hypothetical protein
VPSAFSFTKEELMAANPIPPQDKNTDLQNRETISNRTSFSWPIFAAVIVLICLGLIAYFLLYR